MNAHDRQHGIDEAARARAELYQTLGQLQDRLNYARRVDEAVADARVRLAAEQRERPVVFAAGVAGVAAIAGLAVWGAVSAVMKRFG
ncbi:DUF3618 domain-containing protein [Leucobacter ruminantium]|uniref:DUF3618 domain-containing protein n=1 Tax=Leucobacter ruminantium TaxID=1289170 RepID=A0A939RWF5_9MICO|nr:DUF3618 domain-containing protein [Leucobacter ruminantium]MBO1804967.1 DUF3618 domain-containing protein [Leucobacter ruminantium]